MYGMKVLVNAQVNRESRPMEDNLKSSDLV